MYSLLASSHHLVLPLLAPLPTLLLAYSLLLQRSWQVHNSMPLLELDSSTQRHTILLAHSQTHPNLSSPLRVSISFLVAVEHSDKSDLKEKGLIFAYSSWYSPLWWRSQDSRSLKLLITMMPPSGNGVVKASLPVLSLFRPFYTIQNSQCKEWVMLTICIGLLTSTSMR